MTLDDPPGSGAAPERPRLGALPVFALVLAVSLGTNLLLATRLTDQRSETSALRAQVEAQEEALEALRADIRGEGGGPLGAIVAAVERIRGLELRTAVEPELLSSDELAARIRSVFAEDNERDEFEANRKVLVALGIVDPDLDLWDLLLDSYGEAVAGYYDSDEGTMVVEAGDARDPNALERYVLAHEFTHVVTDQHFTLDRLDALREERRFDALTAFLSLAEGDAELVSELYARSVLTEEERTELLREATRVVEGQTTTLPPALEEALSFPYTRGLDFVRALHRRGGFGAVDAAYRDPPVSTEQIMHLNRYVASRDDPVEVRLPNLARALGQGWRRIDDGDIGELDVLLVANHGARISRTDARRAAAGWDGGAYAGLEANEGVLVAALTAWDSQAEAREATSVFGRWLPLRFRNIGSAFDAGPGNKGWDSGDGAGAVLRSGAEMLLVLGPSRASVQRAVDAFPGY